LLRSLYTAASGMTAQQLHIDTISHNLANVNTTGFKKVRPEFQDLLYLTLRRPTSGETEGEEAGSGLEIGLGVRASGTQTLFQQGNLQPTENPLDLALSGPGFFLVRDADDEEYYTRDGSFKLDSEGNLVTADGYTVDGADPIPAGAANITFAKDGSVSYLDEDGEEQSGGQLTIVQFPNPAGLEKIGHNLYRATAAAGEQIEVDEDSRQVTVEQGYLESSNVQVVEEMIELITAQRAYELNSKAIQASDEMLSIANSLRR
jgi:flagellar basal-body rod protein FlgG